MLFPKRDWPGLADGSITVAFRRWKRPTVKAGGTLRSPAGMLAIDEVARVPLSAITVEDARAAGHASRAGLLRELRRHGDAPLYRIRFRRAGEDPRDALREELPDDEALAELLEGLRRRDARSATGPWTEATLRQIAARPGTRAGDLADELGLERLDFKARVRRLKALGLTESLKVGYRLSPRGDAVLRALDALTPPA